MASTQILIIIILQVPIVAFQFQLGFQSFLSPGTGSVVAQSLQLDTHLPSYSFVDPATACISRRCLADNLINKKLFSAPQAPACIISVNLTSIDYETLSVDTKTMQFSSRITINMEWTDPDLAWNDNTFNELLLPVNKIWTPDLTVDNAVYLTVKPSTNDVLVRRDGTVNHEIIMYTTVVCRINLFTYPFVDGACPVAINGWNQSSCGLQVKYGEVLPVGSGQGEWETLSVVLHKDKDNNKHNYLHVSMSTNPFKAVVSLVLPSGLIMVADLVSFALPLDSGKRSSFKITLVLSFTMFLLILTDYLPNSGHCSPLIRYHFCFCLFFLVLSMLVSMVCTKVATDGNMFPCKFPKMCKPDPGIKFVDIAEDKKDLEKIANFVERMEKKEKTLKKRQNLANKLDKICFWSYLCLDVIYSLCVIGFTKTTNCKVNNLDFWQK